MGLIRDLLPPLTAKLLPGSAAQRETSRLMQQAQTLTPPDAGWTSRVRSAFSSLFSQLKRLFHRGRRGPTPGARLEFTTIIDARDLAESTQMHKHGAALGRVGIAPERTDFPLPVREMIIEASRRARDAVAEQSATLMDCERELQALVLDDPTKRFEHIQRESSQAAANLMTEARNGIEQCEDAEDKAGRQVNDFQQKNQLERDPREPAHWTLTTSLMLIFLGGETLANTPFFQDGQDDGLEGAMMIAFVVALFNVTISALGGFVFGRQCLRVQPRPRWLLGYLGSTLFALAMLAAHCSYAVWRHRVASGGREFAAAAHGLWTPDNLEAAARDATTLLLVLIGVLVSALSFWKGVHLFADPYPGYTTVWRALQQARADKQHYVGGVLQRLADLRLGAEAAVAQLLAQAKTAAARFEQLAGEVQVLQDKHAAVMQQFNAAANHALAVFVEAYRSVRGRAPLPTVLRMPIRIVSPVSPKLTKLDAMTQQNNAMLELAHERQLQVLHQLGEEHRARYATIQAWQSDHYGKADTTTFVEPEPARPFELHGLRFAPAAAPTALDNPGSNEGQEEKVRASGLH